MQSEEVTVLRPAHSTEIAESLTEWFHKMKVAKIILTTAQSYADKKDEVTEEELAAFLKEMKQNKIEITFFKELDDTLQFGVEQLNVEDILLISGAHLMDQGSGKTLKLFKKIHPTVDYERIDQVLENKHIGVDSFKVVGNNFKF